MFQKKFAEAKPVVLQAIALATQIDGAKHPQTLVLRANHLYCLQNLNEIDLCIAEHPKLIADMATAYGPTHPETLYCKKTYAFTLNGAGRRYEAIQTLEQCVAGYREAKLLDTTTAVSAWFGLTQLYWLCGQATLARELLEHEVLPRARTIHGPEHPLTLGMLDSLCLYSFAQGRYGDTVRTWTAFEEILKRVRPKLSQGNVHTLLHVAEAHLRLDDIDAAADALAIVQGDIQRDYPNYHAKPIVDWLAKEIAYRQDASPEGLAALGTMLDGGQLTRRERRNYGGHYAAYLRAADKVRESEAFLQSLPRELLPRPRNVPSPK
jgi:hypothetical protein